MVESSIVILNDKIVTCERGSVGQVEFNWDRVWAAYKANNKEELPWFIHVHPKGYNTYSPTDLNCMQGFLCALGDTVYFSIVIFDNDDIHDLNHRLIDYTLDKGDAFPVEVKGLLGILDIASLTILKLLSVGVFHEEMDNKVAP